MEFREVNGDPVEVVLPSGKVIAIEEGGKVEVTGDDAEALVSHPNFRRVDRPKTRQRHSEGDEQDAAPEPARAVSEPVTEAPAPVTPVRAGSALNVGQTEDTATSGAVERG